jgi:hypothetical protein
MKAWGKSLSKKDKLARWVCWVVPEERAPRRAGIRVMPAIPIPAPEPALIDAP